MSHNYETHKRMTDELFVLRTAAIDSGFNKEEANQIMTQMIPVVNKLLDTDKDNLKDLDELYANYISDDCSTVCSSYNLDEAMGIVGTLLDFLGYHKTADIFREKIRAYNRSL